MTKRSLLLAGLPRSGTTVVASYISSMPDAFIFIEPHLEHLRHHSTSFFRDPKLRWMFRLRYQEREPLPMDTAVRRVHGRYDLVGFKETFRGEHYARYDQRLPNEALLERYLAAGYDLVAIVRDPLAVWNSFRGHFPPDGWAADLDGFVENYERFFRFASASPMVVYERFLRDPKAEVERAGFASEMAGVALTVRGDKLGDAEAKRSREVKEFERPVHYTDEQREVLEASSAMRLYQETVARASATGPRARPDG
jgi:hypothetical protein